MGKIRVMSDDLAAKISAGEVVDRPASVVKELVENSLDAGATRIEIEILAGGKRLIRVTDNGEGMTKDDVLLAFERHATSKIASEHDLLRITSLGFRGEALPSIARVSRVDMMTCPSRKGLGTRIRINGGKVLSVEDTSAAQGTMVSIEDVFFNTPARKKFLRSEPVEYNHIWDVLSRFVLSHSKVHFRVTKDGRETLSVPPAEQVEDRAMHIVGEDDAKGLHECTWSSAAGTFYALVSGPQVHRATSNGVYIYVNGRYIRDRNLSHAISTAYSRALAKGRWPVGIFFLRVPPDELDVNVHPSKLEVKFKRTREVHDLILVGLERFLMKAPWLGKGRDVSSQVPSSDVKVPSAYVREGGAGYLSGPTGQTLTGQAHDPVPDIRRKLEDQQGVDHPFLIPSLASRNAPAPAYSSLRIIGQSKETYIVAQSPDGLVLIDQHAAAERICFVRLKEGFYAHQPLRQLLLLPQTVDLPVPQAESLLEHKDNLMTLGIEIEAFGRGTLLLKSVPIPLVDTDYRALLVDIAGALPDQMEFREFEKSLEFILARMACHSSIRAGRVLVREEMEHLLRELETVEFSAFCPHGRPVAHVFLFSEIEGMFGRR